MSLERHVPPVPELGEDRLADLRQTVMSVATAQDTDRRSADPVGHPRQRAGHRALASAATVLAVVVALFLLTAILTTGRSRPAQASAVDQAVAALNSSSTARVESGSLGLARLPPGAFEYRLDETADEVLTGRSATSAVRYLEPQTLQFWQRADGSGVEHVHVLPPVFDSSDDRRAVPQVTDPPDQVLKLPAGSSLQAASYSYLASLPTETAPLRARITHDSLGPVNDQRLFQTVLDLLDAAPPPQLQIGLLRLAESIPGVGPAADVTDAFGRTADVISKLDDGRLTQLLFDSSSGAFLGNQVINQSTGAVDSYRLVRSVSVTSTAPASPGAARPKPTKFGSTTPADQVH